jgi:hypothetical protein
VQVYAFYHKDIDATEKTAHLMINEAMKTPKGLAYTVVGSLICNLDPAFFGLIVVVSGAIS